MDEQLEKLIEEYVKAEIEKTFLTQEKKLYYSQQQIAQSQLQQPKVMTASEIQYLQDLMQMQLANKSSQINAQLLQQLGTILPPAGPPVPPYKEHNLGDYKLIRHNGEWTLRHTPCSKHGRAAIIDEEGVCGACLGVCDESMLMQLNLRKMDGSKPVEQPASSGTIFGVSKSSYPMWGSKVQKKY